MLMRNNSLVKLLFLIGLLMLGVKASALEYLASIDRSEWYISSSIFECSVIHEIPKYGQGIFYHEAGEDLRFYTQTNSNPMAAGKAALVIEASEWRPGVQVFDLGYAEVQDSNRPLNVERKRARTMMDGLLDGMMPTFTRKAWFSDERVRVSLNSINFNKVYEAYLQCISTLLPVNFRQVEKTRVHFEVDKAVLLKEDKRNLDNVILYAKADSSVTAIYIDGHTDNSGRPIYNRRLSKLRAEAVMRYLAGKGLDESMIQTRYHGERYPVVKNNSKTNKAINRRSTVRLVRGEKLSLPTEDDPEGVLN